MEKHCSKEEKKAKTSSIGKLIGRMIDAENWTAEKIIVLVIVLLLPFGPLFIGLYLVIKEYLRVKREKNEES